MQTRRILAAAVTMLAVAAGACDLTAPDPWPARQAELDANRRVWDDAGITAYTYQLRRLCYCGLSGDLTVTVADHAVVAATREDGAQVPLLELEVVETVDDLFDAVQHAIDERAFGFAVAYHPELGYPTVVDLDPIREAVDEEVRYEAGGLEATAGG